MPPLDEGAEREAKIESTDEPSKQRVGYSHPPIATRFRKGQSGNPKGRPKREKNFKTLLHEALWPSEKLPATVGHRTRTTV